jgi:hypothetical protein
MREKSTHYFKEQQDYLQGLTLDSGGDNMFWPEHAYTANNTGIP